jgi:hypothetical protein
LLTAQLCDVALITIHAEPLAPKPALVYEMLLEIRLNNAKNWQFASPIIERLRRAIDRKWQGERPMTLLISKDGASQTIVGPADLSSVPCQAADPRHDLTTTLDKDLTS